MTGIVTASWMPLIEQRVGHAGDAAVAPDVGRHALERHHRGGTGVLGDLRLLGVDDVHDHAALEHLGQAGLHPESSFVAHTRRRIAVSRPAVQGPRRSRKRTQRGGRAAASTRAPRGRWRSRLPCARGRGPSRGRACCAARPRVSQWSARAGFARIHDSDSSRADACVPCMPGRSRSPQSRQNTLVCWPLTLQRGQQPSRAGWKASITWTTLARPKRIRPGRAASHSSGPTG